MQHCTLLIVGCKIRGFLLYPTHCLINPASTCHHISTRRGFWTFLKFGNVKLIVKNPFETYCQTVVNWNGKLEVTVMRPTENKREVLQQLPCIVYEWKWEWPKQQNRWKHHVLNRNERISCYPFDIKKWVLSLASLLIITATHFECFFYSFEAKSPSISLPLQVCVTRLFSSSRFQPCWKRDNTDTGHRRIITQRNLRSSSSL